MTIKETVMALDDIQERRIQAFLAAGGASTTSQLKAMSDATTTEDLDTIREAIDMLDDFAKTVLYLRGDIEREYAKGYRCSVCGRTQAQNEALGYDCRMEC